MRERGVELDMVELEVKGIPKLLARHGVEFEELGLEGCTLFYRRRAGDMPLVEIPDGAPPDRGLVARGEALHLSGPSSGRRKPFPAPTETAATRASGPRPLRV